MESYSQSIDSSIKLGQHGARMRVTNPYNLVQSAHKSWNDESLQSAWLSFSVHEPSIGREGPLSPPPAWRPVSGAGGMREPDIRNPR